MKVSAARKYDAEDHLTLSFEATYDPTADLKSELAPLLEALEARAGAWMPDFVEGSRPYPYSRSAVLTALEENRRRRSTSVSLSQTSGHLADMSVGLWLPPSGKRIHVYISVQPIALFGDAALCQGFMDMVRAWASHYPVTLATANSVAEEQLVDAANQTRDAVASETLDADGIHEVAWLNIFGPKQVASVGRERVLSTPAYRVEEFPSGAVLVVLRPTAADFASDEARVVQARALVHLRPDLDFDAVLRALRARSAALAPVEPRFHPDLAPLLSRLIPELRLSERQRKIAELNAWRPSEPEEWLPAALPADVEDPERALAHFDELSESLVAALHVNIPSLFDATPESLTDLDLHFLKERFPERYLRDFIDEHTVPALGAYLGNVLVRRLNGTWVPRRKLEESQVRVGNRVWLPFLRARRCMQSSQSLLDCSLTQFFLEATRRRS
ncbi:hypothetical protein VZQ01_27290 [Myxococcus faecalis]|uniref:hypothetical protein n=1 Tax=Myxococcus faecalis TaxID=3115646 RepID=UPI003CF251EE